MTTRRSTGKMHVARSLWYAQPGVVELKTAPLPPPGPGEARVRTLFSGVSRGTERLILNGHVPKSEWQRMQAPLQEGRFPFPVKYGYCATGVVEEGPEALMGRTVFCLHPHQDRFVAPVGMLAPLPEAVPAKRATLAANMETALNAHWDAGSGPGDRIVVVGAGIVGLLIARLAARLPGVEVTIVDVASERHELATQLGADFATPETAPSGSDVVFHTSATGAGLTTALGAAGDEATVVEVSWYGDKPVCAPLGGAFHAGRIKLVSSQVGKVAASRRPRWDYRRRMEAALGLLQDEVLDILAANEIAFEDAPTLLPEALASDASGLAPVLRY
ncbi:MAG: dehydrogenase [Hyphomicrobiaceae bacterium]